MPSLLRLLLTLLTTMSILTANATPETASDRTKFQVGIYIGTFDSEEEAFAGWRELPLGSRPEGSPILLDQSAKLIGLRPPAGTTDFNGLIYMILLRQQNGQVQAFFTIPETPWFDDEEKAKQIVKHFHNAGSPLSRVFTRR
jgi:hypothetical protein